MVLFWEVYVLGYLPLMTRLEILLINVFYKAHTMLKNLLSGRVTLMVWLCSVWYVKELVVRSCHIGGLWWFGCVVGDMLYNLLSGRVTLVVCGGLVV